MYMENGGKSITRVKIYRCGYCKNNLAHVFKHQKREERIFPALAVLIQHKIYGNILYDSGYSELIYKNHLLSFLYNAVNQTFITSSDTILSKLQKDGIGSDSIKRVILSHAHPDHIGGLRFFHDYTLISTEKVIHTLKKGNALNLVFRNMVPGQDIKYSFVKHMEGATLFDGYFEKIYDVLGDGSILGIELNGHADGQLGIYLPDYNLLFAADACWGADLLCKVKEMRFVAKRIQNQYREYVNTAMKMERFVKDHPDIKIIYSHDNMEEAAYE